MAAKMEIELEAAVGRYMTLEIQGRANRIYFETAGTGIPLVCLHTAGADATQYRHLLNDPGITQDYQVIAFDLPWHGKSLPPVGYHLEEYNLTTELYVDTVMAVCRALDLLPSLGLEPIITHQLPLGEAERGVRIAKSGQGAKVVLDCHA